jgi:AraC family transcriptional regulator
MTPSSPAQTTAEGLMSHFPGEVHHIGRGPAWKDLLVEIRSPPLYQEAMFVPAVPEPQVVWALQGSQVFEEREPGGEWMRSEVRAGDMFLTASPTPYEARWKAREGVPTLIMTVYVGLPVLLEASKDLLGPEAAIPVLRDFSAQPDEPMRQLLDHLRRELVDRTSASELFVQSLARSLAVHLVRTYGQPDQPAMRRQPGLSAFQLAQLDQFLESRLDQNLHLSDLAEALGMSQFHFGRLFKKSTGVSPARYLTRMRNARARRLLRESERSILDISLEVGYATASHFTEVFRKETGVTPSEYRKHL